MIKKIYNYLKNKICLNVHIFLRVATNDLYIVAFLILLLLYIYSCVEYPSIKQALANIK